jgi:hypothetical protein
MQKIVGIRSGRPDYSQSIEKSVSPISPAEEVESTRSYFLNFSQEIPAQTPIIVTITDEHLIPLPREGERFKTKKIVVSTSADILIAADLLAMDQTGATTGLMSDIQYQRLTLEPELITVAYPLRVALRVANLDSQPRIFQIFWIGAEESI